MAFQTVAELQTDALWLAGEPTDGSSDFHDRIVEYLQATYDALVGGGPLGGAIVNVVDWLWLQERGSVTLEPAFDSGTTTGLFVVDSTSVLLSDPIGTNLVGYALTIPDFDVVLRVVAQAASNLNIAIDPAWTGDGVSMAPTNTAFTASKRDYDLPSDFHRFVSPLVGPSGQRLSVLNSRSLDDHADSSTTRLALVGNNTLRASADVTTRITYRFDYIARPQALVVGGANPLVPIPHRRILSYGAAYLALLDKEDDKSASLYQQFATQWDAMERDQNRNFRNASTRWGQLTNGVPHLSTLWRW